MQLLCVNRIVYITRSNSQYFFFPFECYKDFLEQFFLFHINAFPVKQMQQRQEYRNHFSSGFFRNQLREGNSFPDFDVIKYFNYSCLNIIRWLNQSFNSFFHSDFAVFFSVFKINGFIQG